MLEILSETKDPTRVQPHLKKCFEGIAKLIFTDELEITHMISSEKEVIELNEVISTTATRGKVEEWLLTLEGVMKRSVRDRVSDGVDSYAKMDRVEWIKVQPGQVALCVGQTYWTSGMHTAIKAGIPAIKAYFDKQNEDLGHIVQLVRGKVPKLVRKTCEAMVTMDVHSRDVTLDLFEKNCAAENDFNWLAQLRYYWEGPDGEKAMLARMINSTCKYAYVPRRRPPTRP
jgi:dynein heavy chain